MSSHKSLRTYQKISIALFIVAIACVIGILNGMRNMEVQAGLGEMGSSAIIAKTSRAWNYGVIALTCMALDVLVSTVGWWRENRR